MDSIRVAKVSDVSYNKAGSGVATGSLHLTAHHLIYKSDAPNEDEMWIAYPLISLVTRMPQSLTGSTSVTFRCRTFETFSLTFANEQVATDVFESVRELTVITSVTQLYAFNYQPNPPLPTSTGWSIYSPREEFARMGIGSRTKAWRFTDINKNFSLCPTYPARLVVPTKISDSTLSYACKYRSKSRIPTLAYLHWANFGTITRSSQPMVGLANNRSIQDEKLIEAIFRSHQSPDNPFNDVKLYGATATNLIIDARPTTNAMANVAKGAGTENMDNYKEGKKAYLGVDNIHVMRESLARVVEALREPDLNAATASQNTDPPDPSSLGVGGFVDRQALRKSGWLRHISALLEGAVLIARNVHVNSSHVLIHCSDGWDRTAQLSSLSQLCLDPFYRTIRGFEILIEKDWVSFGHRFLDRCGHLSSEKFFLTANAAETTGGAEAAQAFLASVQNRFASQHHLKETSPVFHQFLECVRQIQRQFPDRFEFNARFLEKMHYHLYACQFGTFLFNNEKERRVGHDGPSPCERTISVWDWFNTPEEMAKNKNESYDPSLDDPTRRVPDADMGVLLPNPKDVRFWHELYGRTDDEMNGKIVTIRANGVEVTGPGETAEDFNAVTSGTSPPRSSSTPPVASTMNANIEAFGPEKSFAASASESSLPTKPERTTPTHPESFRPFGTVNSAYSLETTKLGPAEAGPSSLPRQRKPSPSMPKLPDSFTGGGFKSMWGKLSSNASAAFSAVQDAYEGVTKEYMASMAASDTPSGSPSAGGELQVKSSSEPSLPTGDTTAPFITTPASLEIEGNPWAAMTSRTPPSPQSRHEEASPPLESSTTSVPADPSILQQPTSLNYSTNLFPSPSLTRSSRVVPPSPPPSTDTTISVKDSQFDNTLPPDRSSGGIRTEKGDAFPPQQRPPTPGPGPQSDPLGVGFL